MALHKTHTGEITDKTAQIARASQVCCLCGDKRILIPSFHWDLLSCRQRVHCAPLLDPGRGGEPPIRKIQEFILLSRWLRPCRHPLCPLHGWFVGTSVSSLRQTPPATRQSHVQLLLWRRGQEGSGPVRLGTGHFAVYLFRIFLFVVRKNSPKKEGAFQPTW